MKKIGKNLIALVITIILFIALLISSLIYTIKYQITNITEIKNKDNYKIIFQEVGEPEWPYGRTKVKVTLVDPNDEKIESFDEYINNDGAEAQKDNIEVNWHKDYVEIILRGEEQNDDIHKIKLERGKK